MVKLLWLAKVIEDIETEAEHLLPSILVLKIRCMLLFSFLSFQWIEELKENRLEMMAYGRALGPFNHV